MRVSRFWCVAVGVLLANSSWAASCHLGKYGTLLADVVGEKATTTVKINGTDTRFILDTGAAISTMSAANASALGLKLKRFPYYVRLLGVGGNADAQFTEVEDFGALDTTLHKIDFLVGGTDMGRGLLGANLLDLADLEIDLAHGKLTLFEADHCRNVPLAYWSKDGNYEVTDLEPSGAEGDRRTFLRVTVNGKPMRALLDSGAWPSVLTRRAAERAGIHLNNQDATVSGFAAGIGAKLVKTWTVPVDSVSIGTETIQHTKMMVTDSGMGDSTDMLLGLDFLLAHHMFIANSDRKAYFTYNGGRVFALAATSDDGAAGPAPAAGSTAKTASDFALRGEAHLSRGESKAALADLDEAIRMAPDQAAYYLARARAKQANNQPDDAIVDLDKSLSLDPKNVDALLLRADVRMGHKDRQGALADLKAAGALAPRGSKQALSIAYRYTKFGPPAAALPLLDDWIGMHGEDARLGWALSSRCWARALSNQMLDGALKDCRKAIRRDGSYPNYLSALGLVELRLGHYAESIKACKQAVAQESHSAWARYCLGVAEIRSGQIAAGTADLAAARALEPSIEASATAYGITVPAP